MVNIRSGFRRGFLKSAYGVAVCLIVFLPLSISVPAFAEDECTPPADSGPGVHRPVGSDAHMFTYDCVSSLWVSERYVFDPATGERTPREEIVYTYNASSGAYDYDMWIFHAPSSSYVLEAFSTANPPAGARTVGGPTAASGSSISNTGPGSNNTIDNNGGAVNGSINGTGPNSNNTIGGNAGSNLNATSATTAGINNLLAMVANSGNASVLGNGLGGNATSGNAEDIANIMNLLQSSSNALSGDMLTFVANLDGDVNGDLMLDPNLLGTVQAASRPPVGDNNITFNNEVDAAINNDVDLLAASGNATVANNTRAGDATSGNARAIANIINVINSAISSGKSFLGVININGNLNGDILLPPDFINQLLAANVPTVDIIMNTGPNSNNTIDNNGGNTNLDITNDNDLGITNNVNASATSGQADVSGNTNAGNATSGNARTSITAFNLTGSQVIGSNALLVFVNVMGEWVGLIVNAPPGSTAAALGGGITSSGPGNTNATINNDNDLSINNNINVAARSGDARVNHNTTGGNARSGDADVAINLLNIENSSLGLTNWFGILFINVFGTWNGSFGVDTAAGNPAAAAANGSGGPSGSAIFAPAQVFRFVPHGSGGSGGSSGGFGVVPYSASISNTGPGSSNTVLAGNSNGNSAASQMRGDGSNLARNIALIAAGVIIFNALDIAYTRRKSHKAGV